MTEIGEKNSPAMKKKPIRSPTPEARPAVLTGATSDRVFKSGGRGSRRAASTERPSVFKGCALATIAGVIFVSRTELSPGGGSAGASPSRERPVEFEDTFWASGTRDSEVERTRKPPTSSRIA